ncbi:cellulose biosynthesis protein BcsF [bacterium]|nr:cellulose biosynthesis protein BcsF [bacterium]
MQRQVSGGSRQALASPRYLKPLRVLQHQIQA